MSASLVPQLDEGAQLLYDDLKTHLEGAVKAFPAVRTLPRLLAQARLIGFQLATEFPGYEDRNGLVQGVVTNILYGMLETEMAIAKNGRPEVYDTAVDGARRRSEEPRDGYVWSEILECYLETEEAFKARVEGGQ